MQIPYILDSASNFVAGETAAIAQAMANIEANSCVKFVARDPAVDFDYVFITTASSGCFVSPAGYNINRGPHTLNLQRSGCFVSF